MARRSNLQIMFESLLDQIASAVAARLPAREASGRAACAVPGCGMPHSGPRYRFFCREHKASLGKREQDRILADRAASGVASRASLPRRPSPRKGKKLDMSCRVAGCKNVSGGPRHGFMCQTHQKLSKKDQREAREKWKAAKAA
jgi:hypothetical protein